MKKTTKWILISFVLVISIALVASQAVKADNDPTSGSIIKGKGLSTLYYLGEDGKRYVFPNAKTYFSWFDDFSGVQEIDMDDLVDYPLGGNVRYKPGVYLVKIQTNPRVYAVGQNGTLHWVKTEQLARRLYGANWNLLIDDVPDSFFVNYNIGDPIEDEEEYDPEENEEEVSDIGINLGLKIRQRIHNRVQAATERRCRWLTNAIERIQKRMDKWGIEAPEIGEDFLADCVDSSNGSNGNGNGSSRKITICHIPPGDPDNAQTISVSRAAARAHLAHGDTVGECADEGDGDEEDDTTAPVITNISVEVGVSTTTITWTTDEESDSEVEYADESLASSTSSTVVTDGTMTTSHSIELTGLTASTTYYFKVKSTDDSDNQAVSDEGSFTTNEEPVEADTTAPVISGITVDTQATSTTISWITDEESSSKAVYSLNPISTATSTDSILDSALVLSHSLELTGLTASTTYYFYVESEDASANIASSTEDSFITD